MKISLISQTRHYLIWTLFILGGIALSYQIFTSNSPSYNIPPEVQSSPGWHKQSLQYNQKERVFRYYVPENLPDEAPTMALLHGGTQSMDTIFNSRTGGTNEWPQIAEEEQMVLLVPNGINPKTNSPTGDNQFWNDCRAPNTVDGPQSTADDVGFIMEMKDWVSSHLSTNPQQFYVSGTSNGGMMAYRLAIERPEEITGIATFSAHLPVESECGPPSTSVPVFMANGTQDPILPFRGGNADGRGPFLSAPETRDQWVKSRTSNPRYETSSLPDQNSTDESSVICEDMISEDSTAPVRFCRIEGGGHTVPSIKHEIPRWVQGIVGPQNRDLEGARLAWKFLQSQKQ